MDRKQEVLNKLMRYCAYQERCHQEVRNKIIKYEIYGDDLEEIIVYLIEQNYLNEERFAISFAGGKFRMKNWGKNRIRFELQKREISDYCIEKAVCEIEEDAYIVSLTRIIENQMEKYSELGLLLSKDKALKYSTGRGFEIDTVLKLLRKY